MHARKVFKKDSEGPALKLVCSVCLSESHVARASHGLTATLCALQYRQKCSTRTKRRGVAAPLAHHQPIKHRMYRHKKSASNVSVRRCQQSFDFCTRLSSTPFIRYGIFVWLRRSRIGGRAALTRAGELRHPLSPTRFTPLEELQPRERRLSLTPRRAVAIAAAAPLTSEPLQAAGGRRLLCC